MKKLKRILLLVAMAIYFGIYTGSAQIFVAVRPTRPHYERVVAPSPRHIWIEEDWEPRDRGYVFVGGHWAEPPRANVRWIPGHWRQKPRGWVWIRGHWR